MRTVILIDFDDTIFPTTFFQEMHNPIRMETHQKISHWIDNCNNVPSDEVIAGIKDLLNHSYGIVPKISEKLRSDLDNLQIVILNLLEKLTSYGDVHIVTNSVNGWIENVTERWLPLLHSFLFEKKGVKSINSTREHFTYNKYTIMRNVIYTHYPDDNCFHLVSIGDSNYERNGIIRLYNDLLLDDKTVNYKSIKLVERPTLPIFNQQLNTIQSTLQKVMEHTDNLDLMVNVHFVSQDSSPTLVLPIKEETNTEQEPAEYYDGPPII